VVSTGGWTAFAAGKRNCARGGEGRGDAVPSSAGVVAAAFAGDAADSRDVEFGAPGRECRRSGFKDRCGRAGPNGARSYGAIACAGDQREVSCEPASLGIGLSNCIARYEFQWMQGLLPLDRVVYNQETAAERASYNGSIEASQASDVGSIPIARSRFTEDKALNLRLTPIQHLTPIRLLGARFFRPAN
jgi:hypothetical protein